MLNKRQNDCFLKQRTHYRLENGSLGLLRLFIAVMKFATLLMPSSVYMSVTPFSKIPQSKVLSLIFLKKKKRKKFECRLL